MLENQNGETVTADTLEDLLGVDPGSFDGLPNSDSPKISADFDGKIQPFESGPYDDALKFFTSGVSASLTILMLGSTLSKAGAPKAITNVAAEVAASSLAQLVKEYRKTLQLLKDNGIAPPNPLDTLPPELHELYNSSKAKAEPAENADPDC